MAIRLIKSIDEMREFIGQAKAQKKIIGLVPTMGALHEGHLSLVRMAKEMCHIVVVSVFVNPTQFGPNEDLDKYPRDVNEDCLKVDSAGGTVVFAPEADEMYPDGFSSFVNVSGITEKLCGLSRPGHFQGVATVVSKFFNIVKPDYAYFGQKDAQQALVIEKFVNDLNFDVKICVGYIVRDEDGLALSSRNQYLSAEEKEAALVISRSLNLAEEFVKNGERDINKLKEIVTSEIKKEKLAEIDYVEIYDCPSLEEIEVIENRALLAVAVKIGATRLIDNIILEAN